MTKLMLSRKINSWSRPIFYGLVLVLFVILLSVGLYGLVWRPFFINTPGASSLPAPSVCRPELQPTAITPTTTDWQILFNQPGQAQVFSNLIADYINQAQQTIELAVFSMNSPKIIGALEEAARRGVKITLVLSDLRQSGHDEVLKNLPPTVRRVDISNGTPSQSASMHHKFIIIDRGQVNQHLIVGSYNFTDFQDYDTTFLFSTSEPNLINAFSEEFSRLAEGRSGVNKIPLAAYSPFAKHLVNPAGYLDLWWSPGVKNCSANDTLRSLIGQAQAEIDIIIWEFTEKKLALALLDKARQGVRVRLITDNYNLNNAASVFSELIRVKQKEKLDNLEIFSDAASEARLKQADTLPTADFNSFLHHHFLIVDQNTVAFGTNNWSYAGAYANDEAMLVSNRPEIVQAFQEYFAESYAANTR